MPLTHGQRISIADVPGMSGVELVTHFLTAGWLYERHAVSYMTDDAWDALCVRLHKEWRDVEHLHKRYVDHSALPTATAAYLTDTHVPYRARSAAVSWMGGGLDKGQIGGVPDVSNSNLLAEVLGLAINTGAVPPEAAVALSAARHQNKLGRMA